MTKKFAATCGWFGKFEKQARIHCVKLTGEAASADVGDKNSEKLQEIDEGENFSLEKYLTKQCYQPMV